VCAVAEGKDSVERLEQTARNACRQNGPGRTMSKDVFPNINRTQAAEVDLDLQTRPSEGPKTSSLPCEFVANQFNDSRDIRRKSRFCPW